MTATRSQFLNLMVEGLREVAFLQYKRRASLIPQIYEVLSSKKRREDYDSVVPIGMLDAKPEGEPLTYEDPVMGYSKQFTHTAFAKGIRVTRELVDDELYGIIKRRSEMLGRAAFLRKETDAAKLFNNATATTFFTGADGLALLSASHTLAGVAGTTYSNTSASTDLSMAALEAAFDAIRRYKDDQGALIDLEPSILLIPPESEWDAIELLRSNLKPGTADNDENAMQGRLKIVTWKYLTDTDSWFVLVDKADLAPLWFNRTPFEVDKDGDFDTKDLKISAYTRYSNGFLDPRFCYGSMGA